MLGDPPHIDAEFLVDPRARGVKRLVTEGPDHLGQLANSLFTGLGGNDSDDSGHSWN